MSKGIFESLINFLVTKPVPVTITSKPETTTTTTTTQTQPPKPIPSLPPILASEEDKDHWGLYELVLMSLCIWREARMEGKEGWIGVAWVIRNRAEKVGWWNFSGTIAETILKPMQFSSMTDPNDKQLTRFPLPTKQNDGYIYDKTFLEIFNVCNAVLGANKNIDPTKGADHYYSTALMKIPPKFADPSKCTGDIGNHRFYKLL